MREEVEAARQVAREHVHRQALEVLEACAELVEDRGLGLLRRLERVDLRAQGGVAVERPRTA